LPKVYEIENFSLKVVFLVQNSGLIVSLKHQKPHPMGRLVVKKRIFLIEKTHDSTVNPSAFNYCHQSKIISNPSITL
jgi:hypothetical protein